MAGSESPPVDQFNLEDEYGVFLDILAEHLSGMGPSAQHYGVKGMKWGVRRDKPSAPTLKSLGPDSVTRKTASGEKLTLKKLSPSKWEEFVGRHSKSFRAEYSRQAALHILDSTGKRVGEANVQKKNKDELYLEWLGINRSERGKGYGTTVMEAGREFGKQEGFKRMTLDTVDSPDARHIYEKMGFKYEGKSDEGIRMVYEFDAKHSFDDVLAHYGIKGMKWGVRRSNPSAAPPRSDDSATAKDVKQKLKAGGIKSLSNDELRTYLERIDLEKRYKKSDTSPKTEAKKLVKDLLLDIGKQEARKFAVGQIAKAFAGR